MPEVNRTMATFSKRNSQTSLSLMTLNMIDSGPYRVLRQIIAQVEKKRSALKEAMYNNEKRKLEIEQLKAKELTGVEAELNELEIQKAIYDVIDSTNYIEGALKELGALKRRYEEICTNNCFKYLS